MKKKNLKLAWENSKHEWTEFYIYLFIACVWVPMCLTFLRSEDKSLRTGSPYHMSS